MQKDWNTVFVSVSDCTDEATVQISETEDPGGQVLWWSQLLSPYFKAIKFGWSGASDGVREMIESLSRRGCAVVVSMRADQEVAEDIQAWSELLLPHFEQIEIVIRQDNSTGHLTVTRQSFKEGTDIIAELVMRPNNPRK